MAGAQFVRADLHVHSFKDGDRDPRPNFSKYFEAAEQAGVAVLAITDHNTAKFAADAVTAAKGRDFYVLPGIEISTTGGHLLGLFAPSGVDDLQRLALDLKLVEVSETEKRSSRSMLDLVQAIGDLGGLAIPAHIDAGDGMASRIGAGELGDLISSPHLAGLEFATRDALRTWFTSDDPDQTRLQAWAKRQADPVLRDRGLARLMSSDAHSPEKVGLDRSSRTLTRLRLDDVNFEAIRNAVLFNPKARCKAEVELPSSYPYIERAEFYGGFLDGVTLGLSPNLNCLIGGRGSGKSTALLSIRAAVGAQVSDEENTDAEDRMPDKTVVTFIDKAGSRRTAIRRRGQEPVDEHRAPVRLRLADLGQDESGRLSRAYEAAPQELLAFLDRFIVRHEHDEREEEILAELEENGADIKRTNAQAKRMAELEQDEKRLQASLDAAKNSRIDVLVEWVGLLNAQEPLLGRLEQLLSEVSQFGVAPSLDVDHLAVQYGVNVAHRHVAKFVDGPTGLRQRLADLAEAREAAQTTAQTKTDAAAKPVKEMLAEWQAAQADLQQRLARKRAELEAQGLKVETGAVEDIARRLQQVRAHLIEARAKHTHHQEARAARKTLVADLHANRDALYQRRKATLRKIAQDTNPDGKDLTIMVSFEHEALRDEWKAWLTAKFGFRSPRVDRLAVKISPREFARAIISDKGSLRKVSDSGGDFFFDDSFDAVKFTWDELFQLDTMNLSDRPRVMVREPGSSEVKGFDDLSAGQQRSVLLSLILCAERADPLVLDQPEDHLDAQYIANAVVRHLEGAKERRQVILATHSPNLTVLGDAELVIPMHVVSGRGQPHEPGAVDRPQTRERVCALLEGGVEAYRKRGQRYGMKISEPTGA